MKLLDVGEFVSTPPFWRGEVGLNNNNNNTEVISKALSVRGGSKDVFVYPPYRGALSGSHVEAFPEGCSLVGHHASCEEISGG